MKTFMFILNLLGLAFIALILLSFGGSVIVWLIILIGLVRSVSDYVAWFRLQKRVKELGYSANPFTTFKKLKKEFEPTGYAGVQAALFDSWQALHERPEWVEAGRQFDELNPRRNTGASLGTDYAVINIIGGYFLSAAEKRSRDKSAVLCFALQDGRYRFVSFYGKSGNQKQVDELLAQLVSLGIRVDHDPTANVGVHQSFRLS